MKTYKITLECDEATAKQILAIDGKVLNDRWLKIIAVEKEKKKAGK